MFSPDLFYGDWKAVKFDGERLDIHFDQEGHMAIGSSQSNYTYEGKGSCNLTGVFFIRDDEEILLEICFPDYDDDQIAYIFIPDDEKEDVYLGKMIFAMHRDHYPDYEAYETEYLSAWP